MPARTARGTTGTRYRCGRPWSGHLEELERTVGHQAARGQPAEEGGEPGEVRPAVVDADARGARRRVGEQIQMGQSPIARGEQAVMDRAYGRMVRTPARGPHGEHER